MKDYKNKLIFTSILAMLPILIGLLLYKDFPAEMPIHFNAAGNPDGFAKKYMVIIFLPVFMTAVHLFVMIYTIHDPKKKNIGNKMIGFTFYLIPLMSLIVSSVIYIYALGYKVNTARITMIMVGILFMVLGNYMTKTHQNYTIGIKLPWTLNSTENWNKTHRLASRLYAIAGAVLILSSIWLLTWVLIVVMIVLLVVPTAYSFILYKKGI